jgi:hypothetical protein
MCYLLHSPSTARDLPGSLLSAICFSVKIGNSDHEGVAALQGQHDRVEVNEGQKELTTAKLAEVVVMPLYMCQNARSAIGVPGGYNAAEEKMMSARCIEKVSEFLTHGSGSSKNPATPHMIVAKFSHQDKANGYYSEYPNLVSFPSLYWLLRISVLKQGRKQTSEQLYDHLLTGEREWRRA